MRRKRHRKNNRKYIILSAIFLLFLFSVGYSVFLSEFLISGKGTIIEKDFIHVGGVNVKPVTEGSGLYESEYEEGRYIYRGSSPDNYLILGGESYGIISKEKDGTLKVIKSESIGNMFFDKGSSSSERSISSSTYKVRYSSNSSDYCYASYSGCKVWGSSSTMLDSNGLNVITMPIVVEGTEYNLPEGEAYINIYLNTTWYNSLSSYVQSLITTHLFNVGLVDNTETNLANTLSTEKAYKWSGKVGLLNVSDYVLANTNENCSNVSDHALVENETCYSTNSTDNWIYKDIMTKANYPWLITPYILYSYEVFIVYSGYGHLQGGDASFSMGSVFPVLYLKSDIKLTGTGSSEKPFTLVEN